METGERLPSLPNLERVAEALDAIVKIEIVERRARPPPSLPRCVAPVPMTSALRPARCNHAGAVGTAHMTGCLARRPRQPG